MSLEIVMSIRSKYAEAILDPGCGRKDIEFRRRPPAALRTQDRSRILIYASHGSGMLVGEVTCTGLIEAQPDDLWRIAIARGFRGAIDRRAFQQYFNGASLGFGLLLESPIRYADPIQARGWAGFTPPQSFAYTGSIPASLLAAADAARSS